jgi:hypothetical protein
VLIASLLLALATAEYERGVRELYGRFKSIRL